MTKPTSPSESEKSSAKASGEFSARRRKRGLRSHERRLTLRSVSAVATCALLAGAFVLPSSYVKEGPGPLFDVLGTLSGSSGD